METLIISNMFDSNLLAIYVDYHQFCLAKNGHIRVVFGLCIWLSWGGGLWFFNYVTFRIAHIHF